MRTFLIRLIALLIILWAGFQPGAPLNPNGPRPSADARSTPNSASPSATSPSTLSLLLATPTLEPRAAPSPAATSPVDSSTSIRFAVIGDYGQTGFGERAVAEMIRNWQPEFVITTGDNNYSVGARVTIDRNIGQHFGEFIYPYIGEYGDGAEINRFFPALGNHDWHTRSAEPYLDYFELPGNERYYDFIWGPVHFFALDSDPREPDGIRADSKQAAWLRAALATSTSEWNIVYMHHAPYSSSDHHGPDLNLQWPYQEWGADAVISGHDHIYERFLLDGIPYIVNGLGGLSRSTFGEALPGSQARYNAEFGAMLVQASEDAITFEFYAVGDEPELIDSYTIGE